MPRLLALLGAPWRHPVRSMLFMLAACTAIAATWPGRVLATLLLAELLWLCGAVVHFRDDRATNRQLSSATAAFVSFVLAGVVLCYVVLIYRASPTQVDYSGVYLAPGRTHLTVGTEPGVDVHLASTPDSSPGWRVAVSGPRNGHFRIDSVDGVDGVALRSNGEFSVLHGVRLGSAMPRATLTWQDNAAAQSVSLALVTTAGGARALVAGGDTATIATPSDMACEQSGLLRAMLRRRLRAGMPLDQLHWSGEQIPAWAHFFSVRDSSTRWLDAPSGPCAHWYSVLAGKARALLSPTQDGELALTARLPFASIVEAAAASEIAVGDTLVIWSAGSSWELSLDVHQRNDALASMAVRFVRSPRPRLSAFPPASDCVLVTTECGLISTHPISGSGPLLLLGSIGLDTARYSLLARAVEDRDTIRVITQDSVRALPINDEVALAAEMADGHRSATNGEGPGYLLRFHQLTPADIARVLLACLGLLGLWASAWAYAGGRFLGRDPEAGSIPTTLQRAGWMIGMWVAPLFGLRLVLGLRISEAAPYVGRGRDAAFALVATAALGTIMLLRASALPEWWRASGRGIALIRGAALVAAVCGVLLLMEPRPAFVGLAVMIVMLGLLIDAPFAGARLVRFWPWWRPSRNLLLATTALMLVLRFGVAQDAPRGFLLLGGRILLASAWAAFAFLFPRSGWRIRQFSAASVALGMTILLLLIGLLAQSTFAARPALFAGVLLGLNALIAVAAASRRADAPPLRRAREAMAGWGVVLAPALIALLLLGADAGLALVTGIPLAFAYLLALPADTLHRDRQRGGYVLAMVAAVLVLVRTLLAPDTTLLRERMTGQHATIVQQADAFNRLGHFAGINVASQTSGARALVRGLAARAPDLLEHALVTNGLSAAQQEIPRSLEQVQGGIAYAVAGWGGKGLVSPAPLGRGVPTAVAYAENTFAVFILHEQGLIGGLIVLLLFLAPPLLLALTIARTGTPDSTRFAFPIAAVLLVSGPAFYVAAANIGAAPLTGQNMPFLGLNSWVDVLLYGGLAAQFIVFVLGDQPNAPTSEMFAVVRPGTSITTVSS